ncbi:uncharacterized protein [Nicotiana sylvestris]|uniref:uncharacterized protein n=1 Tax=Nicotiana sylvestris TaxID=4096 RepID=UPI00388C5427
MIIYTLVQEGEVKHEKVAKVKETEPILHIKGNKKRITSQSVFMISAIFWNIRGVRSKKAIHSLKRLTDINNTHFVAIFEPFISKEKIDGYMRFLGFQHCHSNGNGKIWYFWNSFNNKKFFSESDQHITIKLDKAIINQYILITTVYAKCNSIERRDLWSSFQQDSTMLNDLWCIGGDFNVILDPNEKLGGKPHRMYKSIDFQNCMDICGITDIGYSGTKLTWCNNRRPKKRIWKRLDRVFVNDLWDNLFQRCSIRHMARTRSDHRPFLIMNLSTNHNCTRYFRFLNYWINLPGFYTIVEDSWNSNVKGNHMWILQTKLKALSKD